MTHANLASPAAAIRSLVNPTTVALVGASEQSNFSRGVLENIKALGHPLEIFYVNPRRDTVFGAKTYPSLAALPVRVDCALLGVPARVVAGIVRDGAAAGVKNYVAYAAGFADAGPHGVELQVELAQLCRDAGVTLLGPQANGYVNRVNGLALYANPVPVDLPRGPVGVVAQSGGVANAIMYLGGRIGFSYVFATGNEAGLSVEDLLQFFVEDADTRVIVAFLESIRRPQDFIRVARAAQRAMKPILMLKVGSTTGADRVSLTHTGAITGSARVNAAVFEDLGIVQVNDFCEVLESAVLFSRTQSLPSLATAGLISNSGGEMSLAADVAEQVGLRLAGFSQETVSTLRTLFDLPADVPLDNPIDGSIGHTATIPHVERYCRALRAICADPAIGVVVMAQDGRQTPNALHERLLTAATTCGPTLDKPFVLFSHVDAPFHPQLQKAVDDAGIPALRGTRGSLLAIKRLAWYAEQRRLPQSEYHAHDARVRAVLSTRCDPQDIAPALLQVYRIPQVETRQAASPEDAARVSAGMGYPVVLKVQSPDILHKTDVGGVRTGLRSADEVREAAEGILKEVARRKPAAVVTGLGVSRQVPVACELLLGMRTDPQFGPIVAIGLGGVLVEALDLVVLGLPPFTRESAAALLRRLPARRVLDGFRGQAPVDLDELARILVQFGELAVDSVGLIDEFEINPLIAVAGEPALVAADVRVVMRGA